MTEDRAPQDEAQESQPDPSVGPTVIALGSHPTLARSVLDSLLDPHVILTAVRDDAGRIVDFVYTEANPAACLDDRMPLEQLIGSRLMELFPGHGPSGLLADFVHVVETGEPLVRDDLRYYQERRDAIGWYDVRAVKFEDGISYTWREVTDRHHYLEAIAASEQRFRLLAENVSDVVVHADGDLVLWVSPALTATLGWLPEQWIGAAPSSFVHPDELPGLAAMQENRAHGLTSVRRIRALACDGSYHWVETHAKPYVDGTGAVRGSVTSFRLVDAEVLAEQALRESESRYRLLAENASDVVLQTSTDDVVVWVSPAVREALGWEPEQLIGTSPRPRGGVRPTSTARPSHLTASDTGRRTGATGGCRSGRDRCPAARTTPRAPSSACAT